MELLNNEYERNHTIPRSIIDSWASYKIDNGNRWGVYVYSIEEKKVSFSYGKKKKAYSFAIIKDLYIPVINEVRNGKLELFLSSLESSINEFIRCIKLEKVIPNSTMKTKAIQCAIGFGLRTNYQITNIIKTLTKDPELINMITQGRHNDIKLATLENLNNISVEIMKEIIPVKVSAFITTNNFFLLSDCPAFQDKEKRYVIVDKTICLCIEKGKRENEFDTFNINESFVSWINYNISLQAKEWVVGNTKAHIENYIKIFSSKEYKELNDNGHYELIKPKHIEQGYIF